MKNLLLVLFTLISVVSYSQSGFTVVEKPKPLDVLARVGYHPSIPFKYNGYLGKYSDNKYIFRLEDFSLSLTKEQLLELNNTISNAKEYLLSNYEETTVERYGKVFTFKKYPTVKFNITGVEETIFMTCDYVSSITTTEVGLKFGFNDTFSVRDKEDKYIGTNATWSFQSIDTLFNSL